MHDELLTVADVARRARLSESTVRRAIRRGDLHAVRLCSRLRVSPADFDRWFMDSAVDANRDVVPLRRVRQPTPPPRPASSSFRARLRVVESQ